MPRKTIKELEKIIKDKDREIQRLRYVLLNAMETRGAVELNSDDFIKYIDEMDIRFKALKEREGK